jgi:hypothetical protein
VRTWLRKLVSIDARTLGLTRLALGLLLCFDLLDRASEISYWYVNEGLLPAHRVLWRPGREVLLSYFFTLTTVAQVQVAFAITFAIYLAFFTGFYTRIAHVLSLVCLLSLQSRVDMLSHGGDFVLATLLLWTTCLPLGQRFAIDAVRERLRRTPGQPLAAAQPQLVASLAVLALHCQLAVIYLFNAVHKDGQTWLGGTAVYWMLEQARLVNPFGVWVRAHAPFAFLQLATFAALTMEVLLPLLILSPWGRPTTRRVALAMVFALHGGIAAVSHLWLFSIAMMTFGTLLVSSEDWALASGLAARSRRLEQWANAALSGVEHAVLALQGGPGSTPADTRARRVLRLASFGAGQALVLLLMAAAISQVCVENRIVRPWVPFQQPQLLHDIVAYTRLNQGWAMFAPDVPRDDMTVMVDAITEDGRHVDPYNESAAQRGVPWLDEIPEYLGYNVRFCNYAARLAGRKELHDILSDWIFAYDRRTGRPRDRVVSFEAFIVTQQNPAPGETGPHDVRRSSFLSKKRPALPTIQLQRALSQMRTATPRPE